MLDILSLLIFRPRRPAARWIHHAVLAASLASVGASLGACSDSGTSPSEIRRSYGPAQSLGDGTARTFVTLDRSGTPVTLGVALSEKALDNLPATPMPGMPSAAMLVLTLPGEASGTGFDHVMLDWNPAGHEPEHVYTHPHFDFHFYQVPSSVRESIVPTNPAWATKVAAFPTAEYVPNGYAAASSLAGVPAPAAGVPFMGMHWLDVSSPELQPPPNNHAFTSTFIYGTWDGTFIFLEPMVTRAFIASTKGMAAGFRKTIGVPQRVARPGSYPNAYSVTYDSTAKEYRVTLEGLTQRQ